MKLNLRKKRFFISCVLLIVGVLALRPYLASNPNRELVKSVAALEKPLAASVMKTLLMGQGIVEAQEHFAYSEAQSKAVAPFMAQLTAHVEALKTELLAMPKGAKELTPTAQAAYSALNDELKNLILSSSEDFKEEPKQEAGK